MAPALSIPSMPPRSFYTRLEQAVQAATACETRTQTGEEATACAAFLLLLVQALRLLLLRWSILIVHILLWLAVLALRRVLTLWWTVLTLGRTTIALPLLLLVGVGRAAVVVLVAGCLIVVVTLGVHLALPVARVLGLLV
jgi:hypothetical protein